MSSALNAALEKQADDAAAAAPATEQAEAVQPESIQPEAGAPAIEPPVAAPPVAAPAVAAPAEARPLAAPAEARQESAPVLTLDPALERALAAQAAAAAQVAAAQDAGAEEAGDQVAGGQEAGADSTADDVGGAAVAGDPLSTPTLAQEPLPGGLAQDDEAMDPIRVETSAGVEGGAAADDVAATPDPAEADVALAASVAPDASDASVASVASDGAAALAAPAPLAPADPGQLVADASAYLNSIGSLQGRFVQIAPDGSLASGAFYLQRPGKVRFEYDDPHPSLIVADGATLAHQDRELDTIERAPLRSTPLHAFLKRDVDLDADTEITQVLARDGEVAITARDRSGDVDGDITLVFSAPEMQLREWVVTDSLRAETRLIFTELARVEDLDPALFVLRDDRVRRRGGQRR